VPLLEDIPGLGYLFKRKSADNEMEDLLIFITPHILKPPKSGG
jgi:type IV pilus assembly protein PilQ